MSFRFRKRIKIAPGIRLNLGKKSASISFGVRGARHTISSTGRQTSSVGIPGTGFYYVKSRYRKKQSKEGNKSKDMDNLDPDREVKEFDNIINYIISFHKDCDYNYNWELICKEPQPFRIGEMGPNEMIAQNNLDNYRPSLIGKIFKALDKKQIKELEREVEDAIKKDEILYKEWDNKKKISQDIIGKRPTAYMELLEKIQFCDELAGFIDTLDIIASEETVLIEYNINIDEIIPTHYKTLTKTGRLSIRKYNKTNYYSIVKRYVPSIALRIARNTFGILPVSTVVINTQTKILDTQIGQMNDITILSIEIDRSKISGLNFDLIDPFAALDNFEHNVRFLKTRGFQEVKKL
ncbi:MAG TPA: DUF4236 domain-containing protein [Thermoanaerobacterales bacterium]|nr:DUF4236 domain-containing protein [Thermoanaerobacterales bacterium]